MSRSQNNDSSANRNFRGLCKYCKYTSVCRFPRNPEIPVFNCDEYEDDDSITFTAISSEKTISPEDHKSIEKDPGISKKHLGLCSICEICDTCTYPKPEGGVWHCEEYE